METANGDLWLNGARGIVRIPAASIEAVFAGTSAAAYDLFDFLDGLPGIPAQFRPIPTALQAGELSAALVQDGKPVDALRVGLRAYRHAVERGVLLRPLGDILYWMPPYCVGEEELALLADVTTTAIEEACRP